MQNPYHWQHYQHQEQDEALPKPSAAAGGRKHVVSQSADPFDLRRRFVNEQRKVFPDALAEINAGSKDKHWIWFVIPTPPYAPDGVELGSSLNRKYALRDPPPRELEGFQAARAYLDFPEEDKVSLRRNLRDIFVAIAQQLEQGKSAVRNSFAGYGASAVTRTRDRGHVAEVKKTNFVGWQGLNPGFQRNLYSPP